MHEAIRKVRWKVFIVGIVTFILSGLALVLASGFYLHAQSEWQDMEILSKNQRVNNNNAHDQLHIFNTYHPKFKALKEAGFVGNTRRLQWLETLRVVGKKYNIPSLNFTLEQSRPAITPKDYYYHPEIEMEVTLMTLNVVLVHEGDWFKLMTFLRENARGLYSVESCLIRRESDGTEYSVTERLQGKCELEWYTTKDFSVEWELST